MTWEDMGLTAAETPPEAEPLLEALRSVHLNGNALLAAFRAEDPSQWEAHEHDPVLESMLQLLRHEVVVRTLEPLQIPEAIDAADWRFSHCLAMEAELTHRLLMGGAYECYGGGLDAARDLSRRFIVSLVDDRLLQASVVCCHEAWSPWFADVAWDLTFLVRDMEAATFWVLAITDSD